MHARFLRRVATWPGAAIFAVALCVRLAWVLSLDDELTWVDEREFFAIARGLAQGDGYVSESFRATPGLPYYLSLVYRLVGESHLWARIGQAAIGAATCVLIHRIASLTVGPAVGIVAGMLLAFYGPHIYAAGVFYTVCLETFLCALAVYLALRSLDATRAPWLFALAAGLSLGLTALTRPIFLAYVPCLAIAMWWCARSAWGWPQRFRTGAALLIGTTLAVLPWTLRNYTVYDRLMPVASGFYTKLWQGNNELALGIAEDRELMWDTAPHRGWLARLTPDERARFLAKYAEPTRLLVEDGRRGGDRYLATDTLAKPLVLRYIADNPRRTAALFFRKLGVLYSAFSSTFSSNVDTTSGKRMWVAVVHYPMLGLALAGMLLSVGHARHLAPIYALLFSISAAYALLTTCTRFRLPLDPFLIVFAATTVVWLWNLRTGSAGTEVVTRVNAAIAPEVDRPAA
jgi:4-amino-4-deoxy-L-arabinose transferase-like glycosyltransferase